MSEGDRPESKPPGGGLPPRDNPEFKVVRRAPVEEETSFLPMILVALVVVAGVAFFMFRGGSEPNPTEGGSAPKVAVPADVPVPGFVYERLNFLENEANYDKALTFAEEQVETFPNAELRTRIERYKRELGITAGPARPVPDLLSDAQRALDGGAFAEAIAFSEQVLEQQPENARAFFLRGFAHGMQGDTLDAVNDLQSSIDLGYTPTSEPEALIKRFQQQ